MKKIIYLLIFLFLITGCNKEKNVITTYDNEYYQINTPYKERIGSYSLTSYNIDNVHNLLQLLSKKYFKTNNSLYEEGQYLNKEELKELTVSLNETEIQVDDITLKPDFINTIYEQDYLATNGVLKGISLGLVLNKYQVYNNKALEIDEEVVYNYAKEKAQDLLIYMYQKEELKDIKIMIALYIEDNGNIPSTFEYVGITNNKKITFEKTNMHYELLDSNYISSNDINNYNNLLSLKEAIKEIDNSYISALGLYEANTLLNVNVIVNTNYINKTKILLMSNTISNNITNFKDGIKVLIKNNGQTKAMITKEENEAKIYLMED